MSVHLVSDEAIEALGHYPVGEASMGLTYATVREFCEGFDTLNQVATHSLDLKDAQRFWIIKSILATQPLGASLVEFGAGEPLVADILARLGYTVTVVDPFDGSGNGPENLANIQAGYQNVGYIVDRFSDSLTQFPPDSIDCVYSISVVEHIPLDALPSVVAGIKKFSKPGSLTIHAIDHVMGGNGAEAHTENLETFIGLLDMDPSLVSELQSRAQNDVETYFLSAESHNRWRANVPYDDFPMRRVISAQVVTPVIKQ